MRALEPTRIGELTVAGFQIYYETFGEASAPPLLLLPTWQIAPSRHWKMQVPDLSRLFQVIVFDPPGIGGGQRTADPRAFQFDRVVDYGVGLLDHLNVGKSGIVGLSLGGSLGLWMAARYPEWVSRAILIGSVPPDWAYREDPTFWQRRENYQGWETRNAHYWREHYDDWLDFFFHQVAGEPHSTKLIDDFVGWARETTPDILIASVVNQDLMPAMPVDEALERVRCPVLLIHGADDRIASIATSRTWAETRPDFRFLEIEGGGHAVHGREPVKVNLAIGDFLGVPLPRHDTWRRAMTRTERRALFVSSPIGLGHVQRDLAIARELRRLVPNLQIDWLAQPPVTDVLDRNGETIHPLSRHLASESSHWESVAGEHRLHCFHAFREMDEILAANFMIFLQAVRETPYDLWIGDEAWEVDHYLHENPELKTAPYVFMTDFLGWLPIDRSAGSREAFLTADYNAEMIEHVARFPRVRDRALYFGEYEDLVAERFGPNLPLIPDWAREHFTAVGYVTPFDPADYADLRALRARLGYAPDRPLIVCSVGGTTVGRHLLRKAVDAWPAIQRECPNAHMVVVAGPRIDPNSLPRHEGIEFRSYVHNLFEHLAASDLGVVQGGLSTTMELTVNHRPFLYFPLKDHCEQVYHVAHRLARYRAGRCCDYDRATVEDLAAMTLATMSDDTTTYRHHDPGAAGRVARLIAELV